PPYLWVEQMLEELEAGAWKVIAEGRESGTAGIFRPSGEVREGLINEIVHAVDSERILFDAPRKEQQVWFVHRFGAEVSLGNIPPAEVLPLETLRLGLRSDTMGVPRRGGGSEGRAAGPPWRDQRQPGTAALPGLAGHASE